MADYIMPLLIEKKGLVSGALEQTGRRRRDDYTDGTIRIPIESPPQ